MSRHCEVPLVMKLNILRMPVLVAVLVIVERLSWVVLNQNSESSFPRVHMFVGLVLRVQEMVHVGGL